MSFQEDRFEISVVAFVHVFTPTWALKPGALDLKYQLSPLGQKDQSNNFHTILVRFLPL
jgi:hypothetical protein